MVVDVIDVTIDAIWCVRFYAILALMGLKYLSQKDIQKLLGGENQI